MDIKNVIARPGVLILAGLAFSLPGGGAAQETLTLEQALEAILGRKL